jgi:SM-20-related protein
MNLNLDEQLLKQISFQELVTQKQIIESKILIFDNVFEQNDLDSFLCLAQNWQNRFVDSQTGDDNKRDLDKKKRDSLVLFYFEPIYSFLRVQLYKYAPLLESEFGYKMELYKGYECQMTAHNDGHFYTAHTDFKADTGTRVSRRALTFVYYFHRQPKAFEGGDLFVWDHYASNTDPLLRAPQGRAIQPLNNRIVFFDSRYWHEVLPIICPSGEFMDSRFTFNGWLHF